MKPGVWPLGLRPNFCIGGQADPYLRRWWLIPRNRWFNVYLHQFCRSDDDTALHDHPWWNVSILLAGSYIEHMPNGACVRRRGQVVCRRAEAAHRIELHTRPDVSDTGALSYPECPVWTLFVTGPRVREWGLSAIVERAFDSHRPARARMGLPVPAWLAALRYIGWLLDAAGYRIDIVATVIEVDGRRQFDLTANTHIPESLRIPMLDDAP